MPRTILIVDDVMGNRTLLKRILGTEYSILEADNGQTAISVLLDAPARISAVLLDLIMPVMDGFQVLEKMRQNALLAQIPP